MRIAMKSLWYVVGTSSSAATVAHSETRTGVTRDTTLLDCLLE